MSSPSPVPDPTAAVPAIEAAAAEAKISSSPTGVPVTSSPPESAQGHLLPPVPAKSAPPAATPTPTKSSKSKKKKNQVTVTMATAATAQASGQGSQGENTGRWTAEEHRLFLQGLEQHGKGWKKIASLIKSRTVVQIRTHAQKYFQKLAKARQNGEEGDVAMEGRGGTAAVPSVTTSAAQSSKRRRQTSGTKRKAIQSVVSSAQRQGKRMAAAQAASGVPNPTAPLPAVAPALSHYVLPPAQPPHPDSEKTQQSIPSITTAQGTISGPALEDSLFRFLTPAPVASGEAHVNDIARQAGANAITVPSDLSVVTPLGGEVSPTGVADFTMYTSWTDAKDTPSWYAKGSDVDALLDVADTLDWITDSGDLNECYQAINGNIEAAPSIPEAAIEKPVAPGLAHAPSVNNMSMNTLPRVDSGAEVDIPPLPSLFDGATDAEPTKIHGSEPTLVPSASTTTIDEHLQVFENPLEEHDFVSTILENTGESSGSLPVLS